MRDLIVSAKITQRRKGYHRTRPLTMTITFILNEDLNKTTTTSNTHLYCAEFISEYPFLLSKFFFHAYFKTIFAQTLFIVLLCHCKATDALPSQELVRSISVHPELVCLSLNAFFKINTHLIVSSHFMFSSFRPCASLAPKSSKYV